MITILKKLKVYRLKRRAAIYLLAFKQLEHRIATSTVNADAMEWRLGHYRNMFNIVMDQISCLDANASKFRL